MQCYHRECDGNAVLHRVCVMRSATLSSAPSPRHHGTVVGEPRAPPQQTCFPVGLSLLFFLLIPRLFLPFCSLSSTFSKCMRGHWLGKKSELPRATARHDNHNRKNNGNTVFRLWRCGAGHLIFDKSAIRAR